MAKVTNSIVIQAPVEKVFAYMADPSNLPQSPGGVGCAVVVGGGGERLPVGLQDGLDGVPGPK